MEIVYGAGWDAQRRVFVGVVPFAEAQRRDAAGEPYSMGVVVGDRMVAVLDRHGWYVVLWLFDEQCRRTLMADFRELEPGRIMVRRVARWLHREGEPDGGHGVHRYTLTIDAAKAIVHGAYSTFYSGHRINGGSIDVQRLWQPKPVLGDPSMLLPTIPIELVNPELLGQWNQPPIPHHEHVQPLADAPADAPVDPHVLAALFDHTPAEPSWRAPVAYPPADFDAWFVDGAAVTMDRDGRTGRLRLDTVGSLLMPTGRWMAAEPGWSADRFNPFTVTVPPGTYPVTLVFVDWDNGWHDGAAAMRLDLDKGPVATWEMAVHQGEHVRLLDEDRLYGFSVDGGLASLFDEAAFPVIEWLSDDDNDDAYDWISTGDWKNLTVPGTDANVIAVVTARGDGRYPTWIGRTTDGQVTSIVVDLIQLRYATIQPH
ncbi:MAG TPA: DUF4241 domain-containing protein [Mycobacterium sp.]|nr:DUF4241 domain-containing protein [Mycobacterium sp.]